MATLTHLYQYALQHPYDLTWNGLGFLAQAIFGLRFLIQWLKSEQEGHSVVPVAFWYCSFIGGLMNLIYVVHLLAWPLMLGAALPVPIYARNIWMIHRDRRHGQAAA
jgi:lipid-A-disaccharide synthase-like uncharacterized protein